VAIRLYIGVEDFLIHRLNRGDGARRGYAITRYGLKFVKWASLGFDCRWLTQLNRDGGDHRIRRAFRIALACTSPSNDFDLLFELVYPTYWEANMVEAIDLESEFYWITSEPDSFSRSVLERRGLAVRLIVSPPLDRPEDIANIQLRLGSFYDHG